MSAQDITAILVIVLTSLVIPWTAWASAMLIRLQVTVTGQNERIRKNEADIIELQQMFPRVVKENP